MELRGSTGSNRRISIFLEKKGGLVLGPYMIFLNRSLPSCDGYSRHLQPLSRHTSCGTNIARTTTYVLLRLKEGHKS